MKYGINIINNKYKNIQNLSKEEIKALISLRKNKNLIIKAADKGGGVTVMNTLDYDNKNEAFLFWKGSIFQSKKSAIQKCQPRCVG